MGKVIINFESEGLEGVVATGSYLADAARRFGIRFEMDCLDPETPHDCAMKVSDGMSILSPPTKTEMEQLTAAARKNGERLACQTIIEKPGELRIMSVKKKEEPKVEDTAEEFKKEFEEMPLPKKIASLVELEAIALGETFSYVLSSPYQAVGKVMDVMAGFGFKMEKADEKAKRPAEHQKTETKKAKTESKKTSRKTSTRKKSGAKKTTSAKRKAASAKKNAGEDAEDGSKKETKTD